MKLMVIRIGYSDNRTLTAENFQIDILTFCTRYIQRSLFMQDTRFRFIDWTAKIGTKIGCV